MPFIHPSYNSCSSHKCNNSHTLYPLRSSTCSKFQVLIMVVPSSSYILANISKTSACLSLSTYNPLHHWLAAYPGSCAHLHLLLPSVLDNKCLLNITLSGLTALKNSPTPVGGLRHEIRTSAPTPTAALDIVIATRPWKLDKAEYFSIPLPRYFPTDRDLLYAA